MYYLKQQLSIFILVLLIKIGMKSLHPVISIQIEEMNWNWKVILSSEWCKAWCLQTQPRMTAVRKCPAQSPLQDVRQRLWSQFERTYSITAFWVPLSSGWGLMTYKCEYDMSKNTIMWKHTFDSFTSSYKKVYRLSIT